MEVLPTNRDNRDNRGRFGAGNNANPAGRATEYTQLKKELAKGIPAAAERLQKIIATGKDSDALQAINVLLDRVFGKAIAAQVIVSDTAQEMSEDELIKRAREILGGLKEAA